MGLLIDFYLNKYPANGLSGYYFNQIINWNDVELERRHDFIQWLFPDRIPGVNPNAPLLTNRDVIQMKTNPQIMQNIQQATNRMIQFYGYRLENDRLTQIMPICRNINRMTIGLCSVHNFLRLTRMMRFLNETKPVLSIIIFLMICQAIRKSRQFHQLVVRHGALDYWIATQPYLVSYNKEKIKQKLSTKCSIFRGLSYQSNSCYQDSVLFALFALPNPIAANILNANVAEVCQRTKQPIVCDSNRNNDITVRQNIQTELRNIYQYMHDTDHSQKRPKTCSNLRQIMARCVTDHTFHTSRQQDAGEFLIFIMAIFQTNITSKRTESYIYDSQSQFLLSITIDNNASPIVPIEYSQFGMGNRSTADFMSLTTTMVLDRQIASPTGAIYNNRAEITTVTDSPMLIFYIMRKHGYPQQKISRAPITLSQVILTSSGNTLILRAIVVHESSHYTTYVKCDEIWYYYNDMAGESPYSIKKIGTFDNLLRSSPNPQTHGTLYFYF